jgi:predicted dehydrogenase
MKVKIYGAGSIGNHHTKAFRSLGADVVVVDRDPEALRRMREDIYPTRYGAWDDGITLVEAKDEPIGGFDVIVIGTPPHTHMVVAIKAIAEDPKVLQIEKPICTPDLDGLREFVQAMKAHPATKVVVGFNHVLAKNTLLVEQLMREKGVELGKLRAIESEIRSSWDGILKAHPWLSGPLDTYLGYWQKGGGASGEHIHGFNMWTHFAHVNGFGRIKEVSALMEYERSGEAEYDKQCFLQVVTDDGLVGRITQDLITFPKKKWARLQYENGAIEWHNDVTKTTDVVKYLPKEGDPIETVIEKTRLEEFGVEAEHIKMLAEGTLAIEDSAIGFSRAVESALLLNAAHRSYSEKRTVEIDYSILE